MIMTMVEFKSASGPNTPPNYIKVVFFALVCSYHHLINFLKKFFCSLQMNFVTIAMLIVAEYSESPFLYLNNRYMNIPRRENSLDSVQRLPSRFYPSEFRTKNFCLKI